MTLIGRESCGCLWATSRQGNSYTGGRVEIICSEIESALSATFSFESLFQRNEVPKEERVGFLHRLEPPKVETT